MELTDGVINTIRTLVEARLSIYRGAPFHVNFDTARGRLDIVVRGFDFDQQLALHHTFGAEEIAAFDVATFAERLPGIVYHSFELQLIEFLRANPPPPALRAGGVHSLGSISVNLEGQRLMGFTSIGYDTSGDLAADTFTATRQASPKPPPKPEPEPQRQSRWEVIG